MIFSNEECGRLAPYNPRLAAVLAHGYPRDFKDEKYTIRVTISDGTPDKLVDGELDHIVTDDFYVKHMTYTVEQPANFPGSIFRSQAQYFNMRVPNIDVRLTATGWGGKYEINEFSAPIQNIAEQCPDGWVLYAGSDVKTEFFLRRALVFPGELPTIVSITLQGCSLGCTCFDGLTVEDARERLLELELLAPGIAPGTDRPVASRKA